MLKISEEDLQIMFPGRSAADFAADVLSAGVALVVITGGSENTLGFTPRASEVRVPAVKVKVVDTVGAGDTFQAALLA